jgi:hypothetical protein
LQGIAKLSNKMVLLLDIDRVLCSQELLSPEMNNPLKTANKSLTPAG